MNPNQKLSLKDVLLTSRPFWWITFAAPFVAGYLTGNLAWSLTLAIGVAYFLLPYNLFIYGVNDIFDYESDIKNPRKAGIEGAVLAKSKHRPLALVIALTNLPFWLYLGLTASWQTNLWLLVIVFFGLAYSVKGLRFKERAVLDSLTSSFHYASPFIFGALLAGGTNLWWPAWLAFYIWGVGNHAFGAIQDITPDSKAGIASIATKLGARVTQYFCLICYVLAALMPVVFYGWPAVPLAILLSLYVSMVLRTLSGHHKADDPIFHRSWQLLSYGNYFVGGLASMYLIALAYINY